MNKVLRFLKKNWINLLTLLISLFAIILSYWSYQISKQSFEYEEEKNSLEITPALTESVDSVYINFGLNNEKSQLQALQINFPDRYNNKLIKVTTKPYKILRFQIENMAQRFLEKELEVNDTLIAFGEFALPVIIDYNAIVFGQSYDLRENRMLLFKFTLSEKIAEVSFTNSFLTYRCGFPIKRQFHWKLPWKELEKEKIIKQDKIDVEQTLNEQFLEVMKTVKNIKH